MELATLVHFLKGSQVLLPAIKTVLKEDTENLTERIGRQVLSALTWSSRVQLFGMPAPADTELVTISLAINSCPRRFVSPTESRPLSEMDILSYKSHYFILGDPGSGKTTIVKRLLREIILRPPTSPLDTSSYPILLIAREIQPGAGIARSIADLLGLKYEYHADDGRVQRKGDRQQGYYYKNRTLEFAVFEFLNESNAVLFIDGIDELEPSMRSGIESELERLARGESVKIIATCRSGDFAKYQLEGFQLVEVAPLASREIIEIVERWADSPSDFMRHLADKPYRDAASRPLFLTQLILIYNRKLVLPNQPTEVYHRIISICLELWDEERRIVRQSRYAGFSSQRKLEFLAALSFVLTYRIKGKRFSAQQLREAFQAIREQFRLPSTEAESICTEIESHTGIIIKTADSFEFSHLSLQEYLCAYHMVRLPFDPVMGIYLIEYPAPIAVAVSLSSDPSAWLSSLIYHTRDFDYDRVNSLWNSGMRDEAVGSLLSRIILERPIFSRNYLLGLALLRLMSSIQAFDSIDSRDDVGSEDYSGRPVIDIITQFLRDPTVIGSVFDAFDHYYFETGGNLSMDGDTFVMQRGLGGYERFSGRLPEEIRVKRSVIRFLSAKFGMTFSWWTAEEDISRGPLPF